MPETVFDTGLQHLGTIYAKALIGAGKASGELEVTLEELDSLIDDVFAKLPNFEATLASPRVPHDDKVRMIDSAFSGKMNGTLLRFLKVASAHGRLGALHAIRRELHKQYNDEIGRVEVTVFTAAEADDALLEDIRNKLRERVGKDIELHHRINPEIISGVVVQIGDEVYDGSVSNRLAKLKTNALAATQQLKEVSD